MNPNEPTRFGASISRLLAANSMFLVGLVLVVSAQSCSQPARAASLRVLTYNIHHAEGTDDVIDIPRIADVIIAADPDIVALQEVFQVTDLSGNPYFQLDDLAALTGMQGYFGPTLTVPPGEIVVGEYGNGVLIRPDITINSTVNHPLPLPDTTPPAEPRAVVEMDLSFDDMGSTVEFTLFATHFDHTTETNRLAQAAFVNGLVAASTTPALLAGDLNASPAAGSMQTIFEEWTNTSSGISQIDYVLYREVDQWDVISPGQFIFNATTAVASDHLPLLAVVEIVPEPSTITLLWVGLLAAVAMGRRHSRSRL